MPLMWSGDFRAPFDGSGFVADVCQNLISKSKPALGKFQYHPETFRYPILMTIFQSLWNSTFSRSDGDDFQPSQGNRRRVEIYDTLIVQAQERADQAESVSQRREAIKLIARLDARCMREVQRREEQARS